MVQMRCEDKKGSPSKRKYPSKTYKMLYRLVFIFLLSLLLSSYSNAGVVYHTYDNLNRLTSVPYHNGENISRIGYTYDSAGNRTSCTSPPYLLKPILMGTKYLIL